MTLLRRGGMRQSWPSAQRRRIEPAYFAFQAFGHGLAVVRAIGCKRFAVTDDRVDRAACGKSLEVWHEIEITIPRDQRAVLTAHRDALLCRVADRDWLDMNCIGAMRGDFSHRADQRGSERQHAVAVARSAFREQ